MVWNLDVRMVPCDFLSIVEPDYTALSKPIQVLRDFGKLRDAPGHVSHPPGDLSTFRWLARGDILGSQDIPQRGGYTVAGKALLPFLGNQMQ